MLLTGVLTIFYLHGFPQQTQGEKRMIRDYAFSLTRQYDPDAYTILKSDTSLNFVKYFKGITKEQMAEEVNTAVHEACHFLNFFYPKADMFANESYFMTGDIMIECPRTETIKSYELNTFVPKHIQKQLHRYNEYVGDNPSPVSSITYGIYGMMDEFSAYYHGCKIDYALHAAGVIKLNDTKSTTTRKEGGHTITTSSYTINRCDLLDSYVEFNLFISWYLQYTKSKYPKIYKGIVDNTNFRIAYTLLDQLFGKLARQISADPALSSYYRTPSTFYFYAKDSLELQNFKVPGVDLTNYKQFLVEVPKKKIMYPQIPSSPRSRDAVERQTTKLQKMTDSLGMKLGDPVFLRIFKEPKELEVWIKKGNRFSLFKTYPICFFSGTLGSKTRTGDGQAPEGFYRITPKAMNPNSNFHLSFNIGYPNAYDRSHKYTGSEIMVHGSCVSIGCYAMGDENIEEIWTLMVNAFEHGQSAIDLHIFPFRMTDQKLKENSKTDWAPFWENLKEGYELFEQNLVPPKVTVRDLKYAFGVSH